VGCETRPEELEAVIIIAGSLYVDPADREAYLAERVGVMAHARAAAGCLDFALTLLAWNLHRAREWLLRRLVAHLQEGKINVISTAPQFGRSCAAYAPPDGIFATGHGGTGKGAQTLVLARYVGGCGTGRCYCAI
jgi:hypothetical protein